MTAAPVAAAPTAFDEPLEGDDEAACESIAALLTIDEAADKALAKFGREPPDGAKTAASGDEAAAETTLEAKLEPAEAPSGLVCT